MPLHCLTQDYGLKFQPISAHAPFRLICCPLCGGLEFVALDGASVWCNRCNANFTVDYTGGDPGFTVDCTWPFYSPADTRYIMPRWSGAALSLTLKDSGDLLDLRHTPACAPECRPGHIALTYGTDGLRSGLHHCAIGTLYTWRMSGTTPAGCDVTDTTRRVGQERWPETAVLRASGLQAEEQALIRLAADYAQSCDGDAAQQLLNLASLRRTPAWLYSVPLPPIAALAEGQSYLLHHWATHTPPGHLESERALPVWYVVTEAVKERGDEAQPNLEVVSRHICPVCGRAVTPGQFTSPQPDGGHAGCAGLWEKFGWSPIWEESHPTAGDPNTTAV